MTLPELAQRLRRPEQTMYHWRHQGKGPKGVKIGNRVLYRRTEVERWEREQEQLQDPAVSA
jgi:predicted DNA-binding transcriptional regulator AlpA